MRNLKKILALVLALIMSLSLMATASATDFKDDANVGETYRVAVDVLSDLSVFGGDQNGNFNPQDPIRRSEVAAIIYRIATGDTGSEGHKSYTPYNQFADVVDGSWYAGYVTYCANAGYIKGRNDGNFHPNDNVTGYEVLAMILRAVGYDKNNEFVGSNWQTNTASIATQRGVLKNLTGTTLLSQPATREVVAELLFRSIMLQQVTWNANSLSYSDNGATLAKQNLNMEAVTGVVMGNERGNLEGTSVLAEGKTSLLVNGETSSRTLNVSTDLTVIGESRSAYIQGSKVLGGLLEDAGNDVKDNEGAETTVEKLRGGLNVKDAQHFENFADEDQDTSEWLIRYVVENSSTLSSAWVDYFDGLSHNVKDKHHVVKLNAAGAIVDYSSTEFAAYEVSIQPDTRIPATDKNIMKAIFSTANRTEANPSEKPVNGYVYGEVYVGTSSLEDKSDIMSWNKFVETYLVAGKVKPITEVGNGNWLKIIDNNGDGKAEYVLHTAYTLDEVADSATRNGTTTYFYNGIDSTDYKFIYLNDYAPAVGDIVLYAVIDGTIQIHKADTAKGTFKAVNYKERQATDVNGDVKEQSDIYNYTRLPQILTSVNENVEYDLYLDDYGYVRAYNNKTSYALVTEVYNTNRLNQGWVTGRALTAEVAIAGENAIREYPVLNSSYYNDIHGWNPFYIGDGLGWNPIQNSTELNYLKPATHMLGTGKQGNEFIFDDNYFNNPVNNERRTWTNVAEYIMGENGINLYTAAKVRNEIYNEVDTDYIQLDIRDISAKDPLYVIDDDNYPKTSGDASAQDNYVRAVDDTQFFAVDKEGHVRQWVGYRNTLTLDADVNNIHAMYAVATNTNANRDDKTYWVADVIVIEVEKFDSRYESISLIYSNNTKISGDVKYLQALDNAKGEIGIIPNNVNIWNGQFTDYGFYGLTNIKVYDEENKLYTADINRIHSASGTNHADGLACGEDYGIYFGVVRSRLDENYYSDYITADVLNNKGLVVEKSVTLSLADFGGAYSITKGGKNYTDNYYNDANWMTLGGHASNRVDEGDYILWAEAKGNSSNKVGFIVDISDKTVRTDRSWENADFINPVAAGIANEQTTTPVDPVEAAKTAAVNALNAAAEAAKAGLDKDAPDYDAKVAAINAALEAALTKVNEAATVENVETAKTEGLEAIEAAAKGEEPQPPQDKYDLTITVGENVTNVQVTITVEGQEPVVTDYTESTTEPIKVPAGAKVEFVATPAENCELSADNTQNVDAMNGNVNATFSATEKAPATGVTLELDAQSQTAFEKNPLEVLAKTAEIAEDGSVVLTPGVHYTDISGEEFKSAQYGIQARVMAFAGNPDDVDPIFEVDGKITIPAAQVTEGMTIYIYFDIDKYTAPVDPDEGDGDDIIDIPGGLEEVTRQEGGMGRSFLRARPSNENVRTFKLWFLVKNGQEGYVVNADEITVLNDGPKAATTEQLKDAPKAVLAAADKYKDTHSVWLLDFQVKGGGFVSPVKATRPATVDPVIKVVVPVGEGVTKVVMKDANGKTVNADKGVTNQYTVKAGTKLTAELTLDTAPANVKRLVTVVAEDGTVTQLSKNSAGKYTFEITAEAKATYTFRTTDGEMEMYIDGAYDASWFTSSSIDGGVAVIDIAGVGHATSTMTIQEVLDMLSTGLGDEVTVNKVYDAAHVEIPAANYTGYVLSGNPAVSVIGTIEVTVRGKNVTIRDAADAVGSGTFLFVDEDGNNLATAVVDSVVSITLPAGYYRINANSTHYKATGENAVLSVSNAGDVDTSWTKLDKETTIKFKLSSASSDSDPIYNGSDKTLTIQSGYFKYDTNKYAQPGETVKLAAQAATDGKWMYVGKEAVPSDPVAITSENVTKIGANPDKTGSTDALLPTFEMPAYDVNVDTTFFEVIVTSELPSGTTSALKSVYAKKDAKLSLEDDITAVMTDSAGVVTTSTGSGGSTKITVTDDISINLIAGAKVEIAVKNDAVAGATATKVVQNNADFDVAGYLTELVEAGTIAEDEYIFITKTADKGFGDIGTVSTDFLVLTNGTFVASAAGDSNNANKNLILKVSDVIAANADIKAAVATNGNDIVLHIGYIALTVDTTGISDANAGAFTGTKFNNGSDVTLTAGEEKTFFMTKNTGVTLTAGTYASFYFKEADMTFQLGDPSTGYKTLLTEATTWTLTDIPAEAE